jgi:hypothetical protein
MKAAGSSETGPAQQHTSETSAPSLLEGGPVLEAAHYNLPFQFLLNNKKFWKDLIAFFPLMPHGLHRKRRI